MREYNFLRNISTQAVGALIGGLLAIYGAFTLYNYQLTESAQTASVDTYLSMELELKANLSIAIFVISDTEQKIKDKTLWNGPKNKKHQAILALHEAAWIKVIEGGKSQYMDQANQNALIELYKFVRYNNFLVSKIVSGEYSNPEGKVYFNNLKDCKDKIIFALELMKST